MMTLNVQNVHRWLIIYSRSFTELSMPFSGNADQSN